MTRDEWDAADGDDPTDRDPRHDWHDTEQATFRDAESALADLRLEKWLARRG